MPNDPNTHSNQIRLLKSSHVVRILFVLVFKVMGSELEIPSQSLEWAWDWKEKGGAHTHKTNYELYTACAHILTYSHSRSYSYI